MGLSRREWILLVLTAAGGGAMKKVDFQKSLFLIGKLLPDDVGDGYFSFQPYNYGPFSLPAYAAVDELVTEHLVLDEPKEFLPLEGAKLEARDIAVDPRIAATVEKVVAWVRRKPFDVLCRTIYEHFPEMKERSLVTPLPPDPQPMSLIAAFESLPTDERRQLDRLAALGMKTCGDPDAELALSHKRRA